MPSRQQHVVEAAMLIPAMFMQMMPKKKKNLFCPPLSYADAKMQIATWRWATTTDLPQGRRRGTRGKKGGNSNLKMGIKEVIFRVHLAYGSRFRVWIFGQKRFFGKHFYVFPILSSLANNLEAPPSLPFPVICAPEIRSGEGGRIETAAASAPFPSISSAPPTANSCAHYISNLRMGTRGRKRNKASGRSIGGYRVFYEKYLFKKIWI